MSNWFSQLGLFIFAVFAHWQALATGGIVTASVGVYERKRRTSISWESYVLIIGAFCLYSVFAAWQDEHRNTATVISEKAAAIGDKNSCQTDLRVQRVYAMGLEGINRNQQQTIEGERGTVEKNQGTINSCVVSLGKMNPLINTHWTVTMHRVATQSLHGRYGAVATKQIYAVAISTNTRLRARGVFSCDQPFEAENLELEADKFALIRASPVLQKTSDTEYQLSAETGSWVDGNPMMLTVFSADDALKCTFTPQG